MILLTTIISKCSKWHFNRFRNPFLFDCNKWHFNRLLKSPNPLDEPYRYDAWLYNDASHQTWTTLHSCSIARMLTHCSPQRRIESGDDSHMSDLVTIRTKHSGPTGSKTQINRRMFGSWKSSLWIVWGILRLFDLLNRHTVTHTWPSTSGIKISKMHERSCPPWIFSKENMTPSTAPIFEVRWNQKNLENLPRRNTRKGTGTKGRPVSWVSWGNKLKRVLRSFPRDSSTWFVGVRWLLFCLYPNSGNVTLHIAKIFRFSRR
jgi:hypothetical protein